MAGRSRKTKCRMRQSRAHRARKNAQRGRPPGAERQERAEAGHPDAGAEGQNPQYAWVTIEHRDADGNPTFPSNLLESTYPRRYTDVPPGTELEAHVLAGYKPKPLMMVERKIYEIQNLSVGGWRRRGLIGVEVDGWRAHEADWFNAMQGVQLKISDPGRPGPHNEETEFRVSDSSFDRKIVTVIEHEGTTTERRLHEGTLHIRETWKSALRRQGAEVLNLGFKLLLAPLLVGLGVGGTLLWVDRASSPDTDAGRSRPAQSVQTAEAEEGAPDAREPMDTERPRKGPEAAESPTQPTAGQTPAQGVEHETREDNPAEDVRRRPPP